MTPAAHTLRQLGLGAVTAAVLRSPKTLSTSRGSTALFVAGWLVDAFAPHAVVASVADAALAVQRKRATKLGLLLTAATTAGLAWTIRRAQRAAPVLRDALAQGTDTPRAELPSVPLRKIARPLNFRDPRVVATRDLAYAGHGAHTRLDVYGPSSQPGNPSGTSHADTGAQAPPSLPSPVLVQIHGGAWTSGKKEQEGRLLMNRMAARGWICVALNYRLSPRHPWPAQLDDVRAGLAWVRDHIAEYGGDPGHIVLTGGSAGGHLASLTALTEPAGSVAGCVAFYGVYDMTGEDDDPYTVSLRDDFLTGRVFATGSRAEEFRAASPLHQIGGSGTDHSGGEVPDFFVLHGTHDSLVSVRQARAFVRRLREHSHRSVTYAELPGAPHSFDVIGSIRAHHAVDAVERWLTWQRDSRDSQDSQG